MKVDVIMGTRPGIVKMSSVYRAFAEDDTFETSIVYTGQHYSETLKDNIWSAFDLPVPRIQITGIESTSSHAEQIAKMMVGCERAFKDGQTELVLVCGDANTNLAAGLAARKLDLQLGHVESGLRSYDWRMPEEHNRVILDLISDYLFSPTPETTLNLKKENVRGTILECGNSVVDALYYTRDKQADVTSDKHNTDYVLVTAHRQENVDNYQTLKDICDAIGLISQRITIKFPLHPRTFKMLQRYNLLKEISNLDNVDIMDPMPYLDMVALLAQARCILTDSGGLQEESCILGVPCITLRENTERPETVNVGANVIAGTNPDTIVDMLDKCLNKNYFNTWENPFGNGDTGKKICDFLKADLVK